MKNKKQKNQTNANQELRRLGVLIEHVDGNVGLIAEQQGDIKKDISSIKKTLNEHTEMIGKLAVDMEIIKTDTEFIKHSLKKKVDVDEFSVLERRVALLERRR